MKIVTDSERDFWTLQAMRNMGTGFVLALGFAGGQANENQLGRIKEAFADVWAVYEQKGFMMEEKYKKPIFSGEQAKCA